MREHFKVFSPGKQDPLPFSVAIYAVKLRPVTSACVAANVKISYTLPFPSLLGAPGLQEHEHEILNAPLNEWIELRGVLYLAAGGDWTIEALDEVELRFMELPDFKPQPATNLDGVGMELPPPPPTLDPAAMFEKLLPLVQQAFGSLGSKNLASEIANLLHSAHVAGELGADKLAKKCVKEAEALFDIAYPPVVKAAPKPPEPEAA